MMHNTQKVKYIFVKKIIAYSQGFLHLDRLYLIHEYTPLLSWYLCVLTTPEYSVCHNHPQANELQTNVLENELNLFYWF